MVTVHYLDTSAIVSSLVLEPVASGQVRAWLRGQEAGTLAVSPWVATEVASALSLKIRTGELTLEGRARASSEWQHMRESGLAELPIDAQAFSTAAEMVVRHDLGLRAGDALHLAVAAAHGCTLVTLDERMARAAPELGVPVAEL